MSISLATRGYISGQATGGGSSGQVEITSTPVVSTSSTSATFVFTSTNAAQYSLDGAAYAPASSPLVFAGLALGVHVLTIRDIATPAILDAFTWTVAAATGGISFPVMSRATTADAIRDRMITCIEAITPPLLAGDRFIRYRNEGAADFQAWALTNPAAALRRFQVRTMGTEGTPEVSNCDVEERTQLFAVTVAYAATNRAGAKAALDRDTVIDRDRDSIELAIGLYSRPNFSPPYPDAVCTNWDVQRTAGDGVDFLEINVSMRFYRQLSH